MRVVDILKREILLMIFETGVSSEHGVTAGIGKERKECGQEKSRVCNMRTTEGSCMRHGEGIDGEM